MHELEEGNLSWADSTQWALNRLSASQVSLVNSQLVSQKRMCHYYNEGSWSHDGHHGLYRHNCSFCSKQGRTSNYPESKCNFKYKKQEKVNIFSSQWCTQPARPANCFLNSKHFRHSFDSNNGSKISKYEQALLHVSQCYTNDVAELSNVKETVTSLSGDKSITYTILQNNLPQNESQAEVSFDNVSQNVFKLTGRHGIASQSNSKSAQDGGRSNIGDGIYHDSCVVGHFASMTKKECPCTSDGITVNQSTPNCTNNLHSYMYNVQFTNWYHISDSHIAYIVHIHYSPRGNKFFWLVRNTLSQEVSIHDCHTIPDGPLVIIHSQDMVIDFLDTQIQLVSEHEKSNAKLAAMNFYQDRYAFENYQMSYEQYMDRVILSLIERQDKMGNDANRKFKATEPTAVNIPINVTNNTNKTFHEDNSIPHYFEAQIGHKLNKNVTDVNLKNKTRGFLNLESTNFQFIGPDRDLIEYRDIDHVCQLAKIIQDTGLPNYRMARFPIKSGLNLPAWEHYLKDYPDQRLLQYLKFGFPLSLTDPEVLHNIDVNNHFSALQYPTAVQEYLDKEKSLGAILGPVNEVNYPGFHCSPLLTRPKDTDKCRVILNLSYPHGCSLNENVDKLHFDGKKFVLKFPSVGDIVHEICKYSTEVLI